MTTDAEHAVRNQQMIVLVLGLAAARALVRNRIIVVVGLAGVAIVAHRKGQPLRPPCETGRQPTGLPGTQPSQPR